MNLGIIILFCCLGWGAGKYELDTSVFPQYGLKYGDYPTYHERAVLSWINMARLNPTFYKNNYIIPISRDTTYNNMYKNTPPRSNPYSWNLNLARCARMHSTDRMVNCRNSGNPHNDCNGTSFGERAKRFYTYRTVAENYFAGFEFGTLKDAFSIVAVYECDGSIYSNGQVVGCPVDGSAGHRTHNHHDQYLETGSGIYIVPGQYVTHTMNSGATFSGKAYSNLVFFDGAHMSALDANKYFYLTTVCPESGATVQSVVIENLQKGTISLSLHTGSSKCGLWKSQDFNVAGESSCLRYRFKTVLSDGRTYYFPPVGYYGTYGLGSCNTDYFQSASSNEGRDLLIEELEPAAVINAEDS